MAISLNTALRNLILDRTLGGTAGATTGAFDGGTALLDIYNNGAGGPPANADAAITDQVLLASCALPADAFAAAAGAAAALNQAIQDALADASGTATFFRLRNGAATYVIQGSITATGGGGDITLTDVAILANGTVTINATFSINIA